MIDVNTSTGPIAFTVSDSQTTAQDLVITATSPNVALLPASSFSLGGSGTNRTLTITPRPGQFGSAPVYVHVTDAGGVTTTGSFQLYVQGAFACSAFESFDGVTAPSLPAGWTSSTSGSTPIDWVTSATGSDSGSNNAFAANQSNISDSLLTSPPLVITSANRTFQFRQNYNLESGFDGGVLEISIDGGAYSDVIAAGGVFVSGGYDSTISAAFSNPIGGRAAWSGNSGGYISTVVELPVSTIGRTVRLRFRMASDDSVAAVGWRVDTIQSCGVTLPSVLTFSAISASKTEGNAGSTPFDFCGLADFRCHCASQRAIHSDWFGG